MGRRPARIGTSKRNNHQKHRQSSQSHTQIMHICVLIEQQKATSGPDHRAQPLGHKQNSKERYERNSAITHVLRDHDPTGDTSSKHRHEVNGVGNNSNRRICVIGEQQGITHCQQGNR